MEDLELAAAAIGVHQEWVAKGRPEGLALAVTQLRL